jgi:hypothetical protein
LSKRKSVRVVPVIVVGLAAVTAAYGAHFTRSEPTVAAAEPQIANRTAKTDRLAQVVPVSLTSAEPERTYALASATPAVDVDHLGGVLAAAPPAAPAQDIAPSAAPAGPKHASLAPQAPAPAPQQKPKPASPPPSATSGILDDHQIAGLKGRLRLTSEQAEYWPAIEEALRDVVRTQFHGRHLARGAKPNIDVNSPEVQKLVWAAMPLLMRLRDDQKNEVRKLARVIGLEQVASQI